MTRRLLVGLLLAAGAGCAGAAGVAPAPEFGGATPLQWSERLARSELARRGPTLEFGGAPNARWDYTSGLFAFALQQLGARTGDAALGGAGTRIVESYVAPDGAIRTYRPDDFSLDNIASGRALLASYEQTHEHRLKIALEALRNQLAHQPRTSDGGFWHKQRYPEQMWLDGLYMAAPFYARYGKVFGEADDPADAARQILLADEHLYDRKTGLYYHGWDESRRQAWADMSTGRSPCFWGRAEGWYAMAVVDVLDDLPPASADAGRVEKVLRRIADGLVRWQDPASGVWWQVLDQGERAGNYLEASASSMFVYALAKGINRGHLPREKFLPVIERAYGGLIRQFVSADATGRVSLGRICEVAGLGYANSAGRARDGSFAYYVGEPIVSNDLKGVGPFILAGLEMQQLLTAPGADPGGRGWEEVGAILARIRPPEFAAHDFAITDFGARSGADATTAIRAAVEACHQAGGGRVVVPAGDWLTGAVRLLSNVNLHVEKGATLRFSTDPAAYPNVFTRWEGVECLNYSPLIYAFEQENVAVTGEGTLDGQAAEDNWWAWARRGPDHAARAAADRDALNDLGERGVPVEQRVFGQGHYLRPNFIQPYRCRNVLIEGVTIRRSPMWEINPELCTNVTVRGVQIDSHGPNNDGCDPESSRDVLVENCTFSTGDDCIAIKSGRNNDGRRVGVASENLVIRGCTMADGHGGVVIGSEISGGCRNVFAEDCTMDSPQLDRALRLKSNARRGGVIENIYLRRVRIGRVREAVLTIDLLYEEGARGDHPPVVRHVQLDDITSSGSPRVMYIRGFPGAVIADILIRNSIFRGVTRTEVLQEAGNITLDHVTITPAQPAASLNSRPSPE